MIEITKAIVPPTPAYVLAIGNSIGGNTSGGILFGNSANNLAQNSTSLFWDAANSRLGIGQNVPTARVHIKGSGSTGATNSLLVQNSSSVNIVKSYDSGGFATGGATATGSNSFATGDNANASGSKSTAFAESISSGTQSLSGCGGNATGNQCVSFGATCYSTAFASFSTGWRTRATAPASFSTGSISGAYYSSGRTHAAVMSSGALTEGQSQWSESHFGLKAAFTTSSTGFLLTGDANSTTADTLIPSGNNRMWNVRLSLISVVSLITGTATGITVGDVYMENQFLCFKRLGGVSTILGTVDKANQKNNASLVTMLFDVIVGANQSLEIQVTAPTYVGGGSVTLTNSCKIEFTEVAF